jgi:microsomal dipeptidase-like Zn-dependent dipeptidase
VLNLLTSFNTLIICVVTAHINHVRHVAGVDSVGLGAGYDGMNV